MPNRYLLVIATVVLANALLFGCSTTPIMKDLAKPDPALMAPPARMPDIKGKANLSALTINNAEVRGVCAKDQGRLRDLQLYVKTITG